jgi:RNA polymerase sigma factor (sigma-70 family)
VWFEPASQSFRLIRQCIDESRLEDVTEMEHNWELEQFEKHRRHLRAVAYRMLGSVTDADDALQETWLRLSRADATAVENIGGWLTTIVGRVCLDMLRAGRARREDYVGTWLPEPIVTEGAEGDPANEAVLADSVGLALFVVLETLTPAERLAFVLHDMFGVSFDEIAPIVDRTPAAARQLASRARRRVRGAAPVPDADLAGQREVVEAFLAAARDGDFEALLQVLDPEVVFRVDAGVDSAQARSPITGAAAVARQILARGRPFAPLARPAIVNGAAGAIVGSSDHPLAVVGFSVVHGKIVAVDLITDRLKLGRLTASGF